MLGHLKAEEFINLIEGVELPAKRRAHLDACARCAGTLASARSVRSQMTAESDPSIPEPDWSEFRSDVRDAMLSRAVQRQSSARRWMAWPAQPAMAWSLSVVFVAGLTAGMFIWNQTGITPPAPPDASETLELDDAAVWSQTDIFDQVAQLKDDEADNLRRLLEGATGKVTASQ